MGALANSEDILHSAGFHLGLHCLLRLKQSPGGAKWLSGRVLDSRHSGRGFEPHQRHCVVSLRKTH